MNLKLLIIAIMVFAATPTIAQDTQTLTTQKEKISYGIGADAGKSFKNRKLDVDIELVLKGLRDAYIGNKLLISDEEIRTVLTAYQKELFDKQEAENKIKAEKNKKEGDAFLAENKIKEGVVTTESGLQYKILKAGEGQKPMEDSTVEVNYRGTFIDGTEFDSSYKNGKSVVFPIKQVIPGWTEALKLMPAGSKWQLFVPSKLAYGEQGMSVVIGPNTVLVFEVELLAIKQPEENSSKKPN